MSCTLPGWTRSNRGQSRLSVAKGGVRCLSKSPQVPISWDSSCPYTIGGVTGPPGPVETCDSHSKNCKQPRRALLPSGHLLGGMRVGVTVAAQRVLAERGRERGTETETPSHRQKRAGRRSLLVLRTQVHSGGWRVGSPSRGGWSVIGSVHPHGPELLRAVIVLSPSLSSAAQASLSQALLE